MIGFPLKFAKRAMLGFVGTRLIIFIIALTGHNWTQLDTGHCSQEFLKEAFPILSLQVVVSWSRIFALEFYFFSKICVYISRNCPLSHMFYTHSTSSTQGKMKLSISSTLLPQKDYSSQEFPQSSSILME